MLPSDSSISLRQARGGAITYCYILPSPPHFCPKEIHTNWEYEECVPWFFQTKATHFPHTAQKRLPSKQFQVLLTPSSGSFSSFPHGTCSLSVSRPYLALDGTYHPLRAAIPNNSTLGLSMRTRERKRVRGYHSPWRPFPGALAFPFPSA